MRLSRNRVFVNVHMSGSSWGRWRTWRCERGENIPTYRGARLVTRVRRRSFNWDGGSLVVGVRTEWSYFEYIKGAGFSGSWCIGTGAGLTLGKRVDWNDFNLKGAGAWCMIIGARAEWFCFQEFIKERACLVRGASGVALLSITNWERAWWLQVDSGSTRWRSTRACFWPVSAWEEV